MEQVIKRQIKAEWIPFIEAESDENPEVNNFFRVTAPQPTVQRGWYLKHYQLFGTEIQITYQSYDKY